MATDCLGCHRRFAFPGPNMPWGSVQHRARGLCTSCYARERYAALPRVRRLMFNPLPWADQGICRTSDDPDLWFPGKGRNDTADEARRICSEQCPVEADCLQYALDNREPHGIWGGLTERDRRRLLRNKAGAA